MTLNPRALPLKSGQNVRAARDLAATLTERGERWSNSGDTLSGAPHTPGTPLETGQLPSEHTAAVAAADYVIRSYATPITWHVPGQGWVTPAVRYSQTTSQHQGVAAGITRRAHR